MSATEYITDDPSGLYAGPITPALPPQLVRPTATPESRQNQGLLETFPGAAPTGNVIGLSACGWQADWTFTGTDQVAWSYGITEYFTIQPLANLADQSIVQELNITPAGSLFLTSQSGSAITLPYTYFSPGIVSSLWANGEGRVKASLVPGVPLPTGFTPATYKMTLNAYVYSPALRPNGVCGDATVSTSVETIADPIADAVRYAASWCGDHWWWCIAFTLPIGPF